MTYLLIFLIAIITSFYGVSVGGGGLLLVPALIFLGLGAKEAIATATFANVVISGIGFHQFKKFGKIDLKLAAWASVEFGLGALIGSWILLSIPNELIKKTVGVFFNSFGHHQSFEAKSRTAAFQNQPCQKDSRTHWPIY